MSSHIVPPYIPAPLGPGKPVRLEFSYPLVNSYGTVSLAYDGAPTAGSTKFLSSGAVYTALTGKISEPVSEGTNGQVLATDGAGNRTWVDSKAGTRNYNDLSNKPKIGEVELSGTKTLADLGAVASEDGKRLMTDAEGTKLSSIAEGAEVNVQADWNESDSASDAYIRNKPSIPAAQVQTDWNATTGLGVLLNKPESLKSPYSMTFLTVNADGTSGTPVLYDGSAAKSVSVVTAHQDISGKQDASSRVTSWSSEVLDTNYPSEKLVKDSLDAKITNPTGGVAGNVLKKTASGVEWADGGEPSAYIKDAEVTGEKLTLTKKDLTTVELDVSDKRDKTDNTCHATESGFSRWRATLPSDHEWDDQPYFSDTLDNWVWGSSTEDVAGDSSDPDATSVTFSYTVEGVTKSFAATRTEAQPATEGKTFVTQDYVDTQGVHATDHIGAGVWLMETPYVAPTLSRDDYGRVVVDTATVFTDGTFEIEGTVSGGAISVDV